MEELLKGLGLEETVIDSIVKGMKKEKIYTCKEENLDARYYKLKDQKKDIDKLYEDAKAELEKAGSLEDYKTKFEDLQEKFNNMETTHKLEREKDSFEYKLKEMLVSAKSKDVDIVRAKLDLKDLDYSNVDYKSIETQLEALKGSHAYIFDLEPTPTSTGGRGSANKGTGTPQSNTMVDRLLPQKEAIKNDYFGGN